MRTSEAQRRHRGRVCRQVRRIHQLGPADDAGASIRTLSRRRWSSCSGPLSGLPCDRPRSTNASRRHLLRFVDGARRRSPEPEGHICEHGPPSWVSRGEQGGVSKEGRAEGGMVCSTSWGGRHLQGEPPPRALLLAGVEQAAQHAVARVHLAEQPALHQLVLHLCTRRDTSAPSQHTRRTTSCSPRRAVPGPHPPARRPRTRRSQPARAAPRHPRPLATLPHLPAPMSAVAVAEALWALLA